MRHRFANSTSFWRFIMSQALHPTIAPASATLQGEARLINHHGKSSNHQTDTRVQVDSPMALLSAPMPGEYVQYPLQAGSAEFAIHLYSSAAVSPTPGNASGEFASRGRITITDHGAVERPQQLKERMFLLPRLIRQARPAIERIDPAQRITLLSGKSGRAYHSTAVTYPALSASSIPSANLAVSTRKSRSDCTNQHALVIARQRQNVLGLQKRHSAQWRNQDHPARCSRRRFHIRPPPALPRPGFVRPSDQPSQVHG